MKKKLARYRMDNSATVYPMVVTKTSQSLFGLYAKLQKEVDPFPVGLFLVMD